MHTDTILRETGMAVLVENLGMVDAERFIMLMRREPFDYTKWQERLLEDKSVDEIHEAAARSRKEADTAR